MWQDILDNGVWSGEIWNKKKNGEVFPEPFVIHDISIRCTLSMGGYSLKMIVMMQVR
jgi:hypothetical protein